MNFHYFLLKGNERIGVKAKLSQSVILYRLSSSSWMMICSYVRTLHLFAVIIKHELCFYFGFLCSGKLDRIQVWECKDVFYQP